MVLFRFDIEGDEETQNNYPSQGNTEIPPANVHSPPPEMEQPQEGRLHEKNQCKMLSFEFHVYK